MKTLKLPEGSETSFPKFCKMARTVLTSEFQASEIKEIQNISDKLSEVKKNINKERDWYIMAAKNLVGIEENNRVRAREVDPEGTIKEVCKRLTEAWSDIVGKEITKLEVEELCGGIVRKAEGKHAGGPVREIGEALKRMRDTNQQHSLNELVTSVINGAAKVAEKNADTNASKITGKILAERKGLANIARSVKVGYANIENRLGSEATIIKNMHHNLDNLVSGKLNIAVKGACLIVEKTHETHNSKTKGKELNKLAIVQRRSN